MGEREDKKQRTRQRLAQTAVSLFSQHGYDQVTMAQIAEAVGVSRRTAFRYFPSKTDLVLEYPLAWRRVFDRVIQENADQPLDQRLRIASHAVGAHIERDALAVKQLFALAFAHPDLAASYHVSTQSWTDRIAQEIVCQSGRSHRSIELAQMMAAAIMSIINSVCQIWAQSEQAINPLLDRGLDLMAAPLLDIERGGKNWRVSIG